MGSRRGRYPLAAAAALRPGGAVAARGAVAVFSWRMKGEARTE
ncbi:hypothetical protein [Halococcus sp. IIIV-5B]|nr:hypothetical protein [Halococcus sp. IIIV-5B]